MRSAKSRSLLVIDAEVCVCSLTITLLQQFSQLGWWSIFSASRATAVMNEKASTKSLNSKSLHKKSWCTCQFGSVCSRIIDKLCFSLDFIQRFSTKLRQKSSVKTHSKFNWIAFLPNIAPALSSIAVNCLLRIKCCLQQKVFLSFSIIQLKLI